MTAIQGLRVSTRESFLADPYAAYERLRAAPGLVRHAREGYFLVARYDDVREAAMRTEDFSSRIVEVLVRSIGLGRWFESAMDRLGPVDVLAVVDAPVHLAHRKLATKHFAREPIAAALATASGRIDERIDALVGRRGGDFAACIAEPLPVELALATLGFPLGDARRVKRLADHSVALLSGTLPRSGLLRTFGTALELYGYSLARIEWARRRGGTGAPLGDAVVASMRDGSLGTREAASLVMQVLIAGADSTTSLLGNAARMLAEDPALADRLRRESALVPAFVEEALRLESPFQGHFRVVRRRTELSGTALEPGDRLMLLWASANRDPSAFDRPDAVDLERRPGRKPQLAFGQGSHLCLGAGLARGAARTVIERLLERTRAFELASRQVRYKPSEFVRTLESVPLRITPA